MEGAGEGTRSQPSNCSNCSQTISPNNNFCPNCGKAATRGNSNESSALGSAPRPTAYVILQPSNREDNIPRCYKRGCNRIGAIKCEGNCNHNGCQMHIRGVRVIGGVISYYCDECATNCCKIKCPGFFS